MKKKCHDAKEAENATQEVVNGEKLSTVSIVCTRKHRKTLDATNWLRTRGFQVEECMGH